MAQIVSTVNLHELGEHAADIIDATGWTKNRMFRPATNEAVTVEDVCKTGTHCAFGAMAIAVLPAALDRELTHVTEWDHYTWAVYNALQNAIHAAAPENPLGIYGFDYNDSMARSREDVIDELRNLPDKDVSIVFDYQRHAYEDEEDNEGYDLLIEAQFVAN